MKTQTKLLVGGIIVLFVATGFFREFLFVNINEQMRVSFYNSPDPHLAPSLSWLSTYSYDTLYYLKWPLTLVFTALFGAYTALAVYLTFRDQKLVRVTWMAYATVFTLSFAFFAFGMLLGSRDTTYAIARFLAGIIETPAMLVILLASFQLVRRN